MHSWRKERRRRDIFQTNFPEHARNGLAVGEFKYGGDIVRHRQCKRMHADALFTECSCVQQCSLHKGKLGVSEVLDLPSST